MEMTPAHIEELIQKRFVIVVIAHENEAVLAAQIENIHFFNPEAGILLYNGGHQSDFGNNVNVWSFPHSRPLRAGILVPAMWDIMKWLEELGAGYEYIMNVDHDVLFVKHGFQPFLDEVMADADCMGWRLENSKEHTFSFPVQKVSKEWHVWKPIFRTNSFLTYFNPGQVYKRDIVRRMLAHVDHAAVDRAIEVSEAYALEEVFFVTLAMACRGRVREYPEGSKYNDMVRWGDPITFENVVRHREHPSYYWVHPVKGDKLLEMNAHLLPRSEEPEAPIAPPLPPAPAVMPPVAPRRRRRLKGRLRLRKRRLVRRRKPGLGLRRKRRKIGKPAKGVAVRRKFAPKKPARAKAQGKPKPKRKKA